MKYSFKKLPNSIVEVEANLEHKEFLEYYQPVYDAALSAVHLKGFRPGTAPKEMAEKAVDKEKIFHEAVAKAAQSVLKEITEDNNWQLIDQPKVEVLETEPLKNTGLKFKATLSVFPEVKLGDYKKISKKIIKENTKEISVSEKEIEDSIKWILNSRSKLIRANKSAEKGDVLDIDFAGFAEGKALDGTSGKADNFVLGEGKFISGFEENLLGHKEGETVEFSVTFPGDYWKEDMRDKKVDFKVKIHGVFNRELPELTDEFVKSLGKFETAAALQASVREGISKEKNEKENERLRLKILEEIVKNAKIDLPPVMVERTLANLISEFRQYESLAPNNKAKSDEEVRKNLEEKAKNNVAANLVLYQIAKSEKLEPTSEEVEAEANKFLRSVPKKQTKDLDTKRLYDYSYGIVQNRKVFEHLWNTTII